MTTPYADVDYGDTYFGERLYSETWTLADSADRLKAQKQATRIIDRLNFVGDKTDSDQENQFPRGGDTEVPDDIKIANCEIAIALLDGVDPEEESLDLGVSSQGYSSVRVTYDSTRPFPEHIHAGVPSVTAWRYLKPYLRSGSEVKMRRV